jgi:hypothetical protein
MQLMASVAKSVVQFVRGLGGAIIAAFAAVTDPLSIAKMLGLVDPNMHWILGETAMRMLFLAFAVVWAFAWYHDVQTKLERGAREPDMPLHCVLRWIARDSIWASKYVWPDDQWLLRVKDEFLSKWQLGRIEMMGIDRGGVGGFNYLPPALKGSAHIDIAMLVGKFPPTHIWSEEVRTKDGMPRCFDQVKLNRREVMQVWPKRRLIDRVRRNSPVERTGDYGEIFRQQDHWYASEYTQPGTPLDWILGHVGR